MKRDTGTADVFLLVVLLGGTLIPAIYVGTPHWLDSLAGQLILYGGAITVAVAGWRKARVGVRYVRRAWHILVSVHQELQNLKDEIAGIKEFLGIAEPDEA